LYVQPTATWHVPLMGKPMYAYTRPQSMMPGKSIVAAMSPVAVMLYNTAVQSSQWFSWPAL
jgi:hypothetical protein